MKPLLSTLLDGLRATVLCHPRGAVLTAGAGLFIALVGVHLVVAAAIAFGDVARPWQFDPAGITVLLADALLTLIAAWLLVRIAGRREIVWGTAAILLAAAIATALLVRWPLGHLSALLLEHDQVVPALLVELLSHAWWLLVLFVIAHWLAPHHAVRALLAALLAYAVSAAAWLWLPDTPLLRTPSVAEEVAQVGADSGDEASADEGQPAFDAEQVMYDQPALLDAALARLRPPTPGRTNLYVIAFAGDAEEDVFRNEAEYAARLFAQRFDADGHVLVLENNLATLKTHPLAMWTNLHRAIAAVAARMNPAEDILLVYLTSHGSAEHQLLVDLDPLPLNQIEPEDLADALKTDPRIRWKVLIVNACYSGGFIDAVRDDSTMVITSARADRSSFGCGTDSEVTYFGKAFLVEALNQTTSLREAFDLAAASVAAWEDADKEEHSEPQIATSQRIEAKLAAWRQQLPERPAVPFVPAAEPAATH